MCLELNKRNIKFIFVIISTTRKEEHREIQLSCKIILSDKDDETKTLVSIHHQGQEMMISYV